MYGYRLGAIGIVTTFFIIIFSTVLMPMVLFTPKPSGRGNDYTAIPLKVADAKRGRQIYVREGCFYCHTHIYAYTRSWIWSARQRRRLCL